MARKDECTIYHAPYSICSIMVRYSIACRGNPIDANHELQVTERLVDLRVGEQNSEAYLCNVNRNGEVPVLETPNGDFMPESLDITYYFAQSYPSLLPAAHEQEIRRLLEELHSISFFALTFTGKPQRTDASIELLERRLDTDIAEHYRHVLEDRIARLKWKKPKLTSDALENAIAKTQAFMQRVEEILERSNTDWCFGLDRSSALDTHLVVFVARLYDVKRDHLVPGVVQRYAEKAWSTPEWQRVMNGKTTLPPYL